MVTNYSCSYYNSPTSKLLCVNIWSDTNVYPMSQLNLQDNNRYYFIWSFRFLVCNIYWDGNFSSRSVFQEISVHVKKPEIAISLQPNKEVDVELQESVSTYLNV